MGNFYTDRIQTDSRFHSIATVSDPGLLEPVTRQAVANIIADALVIGIQLRVTETYRSADRQKVLFARKATKLETVGVHHYGLACDFCKIIGARPSWDGDWQFLSDLAQRYGMFSGLNWGVPGPHTFVDPDHVQRCSLADQDSLFAGLWYPDDSYNPLPGGVISV